MRKKEKKKPPGRKSGRQETMCQNIKLFLRLTGAATGGTAFGLGSRTIVDKFVEIGKLVAWIGIIDLDREPTFFKATSKEIRNYVGIAIGAGNHFTMLELSEVERDKCWGSVRNFVWINENTHTTKVGSVI